MGAGLFIEVYLDVPISVCERRDPRGLYKKARAGQIKNFTGVTAPYEVPSSPDIALDTNANDVASCVDVIVDHLTRGGFLTGAINS